jgi:hypothetical protein
MAGSFQTQDPILASRRPELCYRPVHIYLQQEKRYDALVNPFVKCSVNVGRQTARPNVAAV